MLLAALQLLARESDEHHCWPQVLAHQHLLLLLTQTGCLLAAESDEPHSWPQVLAHQHLLLLLSVLSCLFAAGSDAFHCLA
jgi:hypothetical protein